MNLIINGKQKEFPEKSTIADIITHLGIPLETVVVELNKSIIQPETYGNQYLKEEDKLEIIRFVGGG